MARRSGRATSRFTGGLQRDSAAFWLSFCLVLRSAAVEGLYSSSDQIVLLSPDNVDSVLINSSAAVLAEFYASWCGHCIAFSPVYKSLAMDMREWKPAVELAAIDCAAEENMRVCAAFSIRAFPTVKFFPAYSQAGFPGQSFRVSTRDVRLLRHRVIDNLEKHGDPWPPACPPLEPTSPAEVDSFFETNSVQHLALVFEDSKSYIGREVTLDLLQFENVAVRRVLSTEKELVTKVGVTEFPSCYLSSPGGNFSRLRVNIEARSFYSYALQRLPGVVRSGKPAPVPPDALSNSTKEAWRPFNRSRVYMADLESALHYALRVEVAAHTVLKGEALTSLKKFVSVLAKFFPGRPLVQNLLSSVDSWLQNQTEPEVTYEAFRAQLDNSAQSADAALPEGVRWVGCQGSRPHLRRYPCGVWTLFHVLTVQAKNTGSTDAQQVLGAMRSYVHSFFGCKECAEHFETMARESLVEVNTASSAVLWLWSRHNRVNNRLAGALSEDPNFPKIQWPSPEACPACHAVKENGEHRWSLDQVLPFLLSYFSSSSILTDYLEDESLVLTKQRQRHASREAEKRLERKAREALDAMTRLLPSQPAVQEEEEEEEEEEEGGDMEGKTYEPTPWVKPEMEAGRVRRQALRKPSLVGMRMREPQEVIVDLDSFVNQHYKAKALQMAASSRVKQRTLQRKEEPEAAPAFGLGLQLDAGLGMLGLQPLEAGFEAEVGQQRKTLQKRELAAQYFEGRGESSRRGRWMSLLGIGFSSLDVSLCVVLYFLSAMCLLAMYLFFKNRLRLRRAKVALP